MTNEELRTAIRETEKAVGMTVGAANREAFDHLTELRMVERSRAMFEPAAGEKESVSIMNRPVSRSDYDMQVARAYAAEGIIEDLKAQIASLNRQLEPLTEEEAIGVGKMTGSYVTTVRGAVMINDRAIMAVKARRVE